MKHIDGETLNRIISEAKMFFEPKVEQINSLNVFPVPDGDTGTNMFLTLKSIEEELKSITDTSVSRVSAAISKGALMGARGNSGVILAQFFQGMSNILENKLVITAKDLAESLTEASIAAYKSVGNPTEGTMLTVIRDIASTANNNHERSPDILEFWQLLCQTANKSVIDTPSLLPVLSEAGVVDAGAFGLAVLLEGGLNALTEYPLTMTMNDSISVSSIRTSTDQTTSISREFIHSRGEESFGYCTQFIIEGDNLTIDSIRTDLIDLGVSNVVMGTESIIRIHSHSEDPGRLLSYGISIGQLSQINISNMNEQNKDFLYSEQNPIDPIKLAIIAVASGDGITNLFLNSGVAGIVSGGESMNPSIGEILDCVNGINADRIVILPNNPNIIPAANQVVSLSKIPISVIPTTTIPQGISAILSFNPLIETEMNIEAMNNSISNVRSGAICRAAKSTHINNIDIEVGQFIGLLEREVVVVGKGTSETLIGLIEHMEPEKDSIITLYWGNDMLEAEAQSYLQVTADLYPGLDIDLVQGGQDYYDFIISVE